MRSEGGADEEGGGGGGRVLVGVGWGVDALMPGVVPRGIRRKEGSGFRAGGGL